MSDTSNSTETSNSNVSDEPGSGSCTIWDVASNILNCTVGSGILALPFALKDSGFGLGLVLSVVVGVLCWFALYVLIVSGQRVGVYQYAVLCEVTMGTFGNYLLNGVIFFQSIGACITYMIVVGDTIPILLGILGWETDRQWTIFISSLIFILPLLFYKSLGSLSRSSIISVMTLPFIVAIVAIRGIHYAPEHKRSYEFVGDNVFPAIGVMAFAMMSTQTAFSNFTSMIQPTRKAWAQASGIAVSLSWIVSFVFAAIGFIAFGFDVEANIFNSFPITDFTVNIGRGLLGFSMFLTFPQAFYPARTALHSLFGHETHTKSPTDRQHLITTITLFIPILYCGVFVKDLGLLYQLIGGFCSTTLAYIIPGACYFLVFWKHRGLEISGDSATSEEQGQRRIDDDSDSADDADEQERLIKQRLRAEKKNLGSEEEAISVETTLLNQSAQHGHSYGATAGSDSGSTSSSSSTTSSSSSTTSSTWRIAPKERKTELWLDIGSGILFVFGVFVMMISTTLTLKKMLGYS
ncbi:hypothetical protein BGZ76_007380 [Entomortierella beljakovae]|nr:hypothetical protein BGZ76_007380 [Entomortierella beljakovae]